MKKSQKIATGAACLAMFGVVCATFGAAVAQESGTGVQEVVAPEPVVAVPEPVVVPSPSPIEVVEEEPERTSREITRDFCSAVNAEFVEAGLVKVFDRFIAAAEGSYPFGMLRAAEEATSLASVIEGRIDELEREPNLDFDVNYYVEALEVALADLGSTGILDVESIAGEYNPTIDALNDALKDFAGACRKA